MDVDDITLPNDAEGQENTPIHSSNPEIIELDECIEIGDGNTLEDSSYNEYTIKEEYRNLTRSYYRSNYHSAEYRNNRSKNRYESVLACDETRVHLFGRDPDRNYDSDYINANYVSDVNNSRKYIACQAPLLGTIHDFWLMVYTHNTRVIVMLTDFVENGVEKAVKYWPNLNSITVIDYFSIEYVSKKCIQGVNNIVIREFKLSHSHIDLVKTVHQVQYLGWPDHGVPDDIESILLLSNTVDYLQYFEEQRNNTDFVSILPPIIVHCSAGVGRTGTYIGVNNCIEKLKFDGEVKIYKIIRKIREQRHGAITKEKQYEFIYKCVVYITDKYKKIEE